MHVRMATNALRDHLTPLEMVKGYMPNIGEMMPFGTTAHVTLPKEKRSRMRSQGRGYERAETGIFIGYQTHHFSSSHGQEVPHLPQCLLLQSWMLLLPVV